ncbi:3'-5' exonuclease [Oligella ureolytica]|jgi:predicted PolB exonuclease-like 3'-5' exonuclease|nr:3'-5' exonuclease [Alcaligenaceae bacterium]
MSPHLVFDLETIPDAHGIRQLMQLDADLSDAEVVEIAQQQRLEQTGSDFMPLHLQKIVAIGCVFRNKSDFHVKCLGEPDDDEASLIRSFFKVIDHYTPTIVSWNGSGFDFPVLHYRALIHGISSRRYWDKGQDDRDFKFNNYLSRYHDRHVDLMDVLSGYTFRANAPLDQLAKLCGFPGKLGMDGSQVWPTWLAGGIDEIRAYCETDVVNTWLMYLRYQLLRCDLDQAAYEDEIKLVHDSLSALKERAPWDEYLAEWHL